MTINTVNNTTSTPANNNNAASSFSIGGNFNTFMTLLTTQLKHQDPTAPTDANQFTQQLVAFAGVQQQSQTNDNLTKILAALQTNQVGAASSFVGTTIQANGNQGDLHNKVAQFGYNLASPASSVDVTITNSSGQLVFQGKGSTNAGDNFVKWDGKNSLNGNQEADGVYNISVKASDATGAEVKSNTFITGKVSSASISGGAVMLNIGELKIPQASVTNVSNLTNNTSI